MGTRTAVAALCALVALSACSGSEDEAAPATSALPTASEQACPPEDGGQQAQLCAGGLSPDETPPPEGSAFWDAVRVEPIPGQLATAGNDADVDEVRADLRVTVRPGHRLGVQAVCQGLSTLIVETVPDTGAALELDCASAELKEIGAVEPTAVTTVTTYQVTVTAPAPSRWFTTFYEEAA